MAGKRIQQELFESEKTQRYEQIMAARRGDRAEADATADAAGKGVLPFRFKPEENEGVVTGRAGLPLVLEAFRGYGGDRLVEQYIQVKKRERGYSEVEFVEGFLLLLASGGEHLEDVSVLAEDDGLLRMLDRQMFSPDAARDFLLHFHDEKLILEAAERAAQAREKSYVPEENRALKGLAEVVSQYTRRAADPLIGTKATLDHDATVIDSTKQAAKGHYKGGKGYQPVAVVWAEQALIIADEFRDGNVPAGKDNLPLIQRAFRSLPDWVTEMLFRSDTACYEDRVLKWLANPRRSGGPEGEIGFTISADMTKELRAECDKVWELDTPGDPNKPRWCILDDTRANETAEWSEVEFTPGNWPKNAKPLRYLVLRFKPRQGELFASGEPVKYLAVVTNREGNGDELIQWHWKKAGTIEHVHDETKNGLGAGVLPCAEFGANAAWYRLNMLAYNVLSVIKRQTLPPDQQTAKAKRVRFLVFNIAARLTSHARYLFAHVKRCVLERVRALEARAFFRLTRRRFECLPAS